MSNDSSDEASARYVKTTFLARVAHDLRGPAGVNLGALDELESALGPELSREHEKLLSMIRRSSKKVLRIAEKLARGAEMAAGLSLEPRKIPLGTIIGSAAKEAELAEGRRGVTVEIVPPGAGSTATADTGWLESMLCEVISNGLRHARALVRVEVLIEGQDVCIAVSDDGRVKPKPVRGLFEPADERRGLGLSLSMTERLLSMLGGRLEIHERAEGGTRVELRMPLSA